MPGIGRLPATGSAALPALMAILLLACGSAENDGQSAVGPAGADTAALEAGPTPESAAASDSIVVDGIRYELVDCQLRAIAADASISSLETGLQGSCYFARERSGTPQLRVAASGTTTLVLTSTPHQNDRFCDTTIRAVRLGLAHLAVSEEEQNIQSCSRGPYDEKLIAILSESVPDI